MVPREPRPFPPRILTKAIAGWGLTRIFDAGLQTSLLVMKLQRLNLVLLHLDGFNFQLNLTVKRGEGKFINKCLSTQQ